MDDLSNPDELEMTRKTAREILSHMSEVQKQILTEASATGRWLTASLLAVNGAAALAIFNAAERLQHSGVDAAGFIIGVFAALASGVLNQRANFAAVKITGEVIGHAVFAVHSGEFTDAARESLTTADGRARVLGKWPVIAGWISAGLFGAGATTTALDHTPVDQPALNRCAALQHDMLRAFPVRADSRDLFHSLGCRSQGEGSVYAPAQKAPSSRR